MGQARRGVFDLDADAALAELEELLAELEGTWATRGYHGFSIDGACWSAISSNGTVLTAPTSNQLEQIIGAHWQGMQ
jgi:hypothetical protein